MDQRLKTLVEMTRQPWSQALIFTNFLGSLSKQVCLYSWTRNAVSWKRNLKNIFRITSPGITNFSNCLLSNPDAKWKSLKLLRVIGMDV
jgi:hypothetical protein